MYYSLINNPVKKEYVGLENYRKIMHNTAFRKAAENTAFFSAVSVPLVIILSLGLAMLLEKKIPGRSIFRTFFLSPIMVPIASVVLAGVNMAGGKGKLLGVIFGALSYTTINFIIVSIPGLSVDIQDTFQGLVLIIVILIQTVGPVIRENLQRAKKRRQAAAAEKA